MRKQHRLRFFVLLFLAISLTLLAALGPVLTPEDPFKIDLHKTLRAPDNENLFGTDRLGRDLFSRVLFGARNSFVLTLIMVLIVACAGSMIGVAVGCLHGLVDTVIMQIADILLAFPSVVFAIAVTGVWGPGIYHVLIALAIVSWAKYAHLARSLVTEIRRKEYITLAWFSGSRWHRILFKYIIPNILPQMIIMTTLDISEMMLTISALSFLGLAGQPPMPEWGNMLADSRGFIVTYPHMMLCPGLAILIIVTIFSLLGDSLRDVLDPKE